LPYCDKFRKKAKSPFALKFTQDSLSDLKLQFQQRFSDLEASKKKKKLRVIDEFPPNLQMDMIGSQCNDMLKRNIKGEADRILEMASN